MKTYLFLLAWVDGSEGAQNVGVDTNIHSSDDLLPEYNKCKKQVQFGEYIFARYIVAPNEKVAEAFGYSQAFHENFTGYNTVSTCFSVDCIEQNNNQNTPLIVVDLQED